MIDETNLKYLEWKVTAYPIFSNPETEDPFLFQTA